MADTPMTGPVYGRTLSGFGVGLLVRNVDRAVKFTTEVLGAHVLFRTPVFAAIRLCGHDFMIHADETYKTNALFGSLNGAEARGVGIELRAYNVDPDRAEAAARAGGWTILAGTIDKYTHGLRECLIVDDDGYVWIPSRHLPPETDA